MNKRLTRRDFVKLTGVAGAALGALPGAAQPAPNPPGWRGHERVERIATNCEMCFWRCGAEAEVSDGKVVRITGNPDHPLTQGRLCARGNAGTELLYDNDRLKYPMVRMGPRGEGKFQRVSWEQALDLFAQRLTELKQKYGPESVAFFPHGVASGFFSIFLKAYGTPNSAEPAFAQCRGPREVGYALTFGQGLNSPEPVDLEEAKLIVLIGSHIGENVFTSQVTAFAEGLSRGAKLIVVDPRFSTAAAKADYWLPIRPGTDTALLLAWMNVLIGEGLYDREYIEKYASGFGELAAHVREFTPEWAEPITEISAKVIRETARAMGEAKPAVALHPGRHVTWYGNDTQRARAMAILTALTGSWGRKGGIFLPTPIKTGKFALPPFPKSERGRADGAGTRFPLASEEQGVTNGLIDATLTGKPYPIKAWVVYGQNVLESIPQQQKTLKAMEELEFIAAVDVMPMNYTNYADVVLPEATYLERFDMPAVIASAKKPFISVRQPAVEPMYDTKPGWWIAKQMAKRMGLDAYFPWDTPEQYLATVVKPLGVDPAVLRVRGAVAFEGRPYIEDRLPEDGPLFPTESGKIELYSPMLKELGIDPLPRFAPVENPPVGYFRLIYGRTPVHSFTRTQNNARLDSLVSENEVWINTDAAMSLGFREAQRVVLENSEGVKSLPVLMRITEGIRPDCAYMVHGFGHESPKLQRAYHRGASDTELMTKVQVDPIMGGTGMRVIFVRILREGA
ncbi:MAG TPA: molybdopterin-dependent oxidoreductase [Candidatus Eisenbacteria bacterium]|nr:molybdopterin-dependent oxidoreductase [Candidatus Eisenbacteria bacterium]